MVPRRPSGHPAQLAPKAELKACIGSEEVDQWRNGVSSQVALCACLDMPALSLCPFGETPYLNLIGLQEFLIECINMYFTG